ncbi:c-type cytochrome biogenesis protein CcmI [Sulfitobacter sp. 1A13421]|uniref:c-type cytochrome biogenesis protein CcmI n=1 Tax=Sulfitobacter sp. 1A13421 TaxID=3368595 RepID=UPI003745F086
MIWLVFALLSIVGLLFMGLPLRHRSSRTPVPADATDAVLMDQLDEVRRDLERGVISDTEATAAEQEIKRRILVQSRRSVLSDGKPAAGGRLMVVLSAVFVPVFAFGYYSAMGSPEIPGVAFAERATERQEAAEIAELTDRLYVRLSSDPEGGPSEGWMLLGQTYSKMGRYADAADAYRVVAQRPEADSAVFSMLAEVLIYAEQGVVTPEADTAIDRAYELDPSNPGAAFFKAVSLEQKGDEARAHETLVARLDDADRFFPWMESFVGEANRIGAKIGKAPISLADYAPKTSASGPTQEDIENAQDMSVEERQDFIRSMVERLATRLEDEPDDLDGWMRLGNAYSVLGDTAPAIAAFEHAEILLSEVPGDDPRRQAVQSALERLRP